MRAYLEILRPVNCVMASLAVLIGVQISGLSISSLSGILAGVVAFLICGFGNVINDYYDVEIDRINKPHRPIPSGRISPSAAVVYAFGLAIVGNLLAVSISPEAFALAIFNTALLYLYARSIKRRGGFTKNLTISYLVASPFLYGGIVSGKPAATLLLVSLSAIANTSREIVKDIEDIKGDAEKARTLPTRIGIRASERLAALFLLLAILLSFLPYATGLMGFLYLPFVAVTDAVFLWCLFYLVKGGDAKKVQQRIKVGMVFGLLAFMAGSYSMA